MALAQDPLLEVDYRQHRLIIITTMLLMAVALVALEVVMMLIFQMTSIHPRGQEKPLTLMSMCATCPLLPQLLLLGGA